METEFREESFAIAQKLAQHAEAVQQGFRDFQELSLSRAGLKRIFRITPKGEWDVVVQYDGWPNGLKLHKDGRIFIADYRRGLMVLDPKSGKIEALLEIFVRGINIRAVKDRHGSRR